MMKNESRNTERDILVNKTIKILFVAPGNPDHSTKMMDCFWEKCYKYLTSCNWSKNWKSSLYFDAIFVNQGNGKDGKDEDLVDSHLRHMVDFEPTIIILDNDYGTAEYVLRDHLSLSHSSKRLSYDPFVIVMGQGIFPNTRLGKDEFGFERQADAWCKYDWESLARAIEEIVMQIEDDLFPF
jgi:hypothetical protein